MDDHSSDEPVPKGKNKAFKLLPCKDPLKVRELPNEPRKKKVSKTSGIGPMCIFIKEHGQKMCQRLEKLHRRQQNGLLDLTIICQDKKLLAHKIVLAASSKFFCSQLCRSNILVPVILKLEDFGLDLNFEAVKHLIEFVYCGKVTIPGELLRNVCNAAHALGVHGLVDFLPASSKNSHPENDFISLSSEDDEDDREEEVSDAEREEQSPAKRRASGGGSSLNQESRSFVRESVSAVSTESLDPINGSTHGSDENSNVGSGVPYDTDVNERHELEEAANTLIQHSNQNSSGYGVSSQYSMDSATSYIFQSNSQQQNLQHHHQQQQQHHIQHLQQPQYTSAQLHMDEHSQLQISTTPLDSDEVEILATSIGTNNLSGHALYYASTPMTFKPYPDQKTSSDSSSCSLPVVTFTSAHCPQQQTSTSSYASTSNQHQQGMSSFHSQISKGKLRIINQEGIITNTAENIQTPSTSDFNKPPPLNYKMTPCKLMPGEQIYDMDSVLEEQLFHHPSGSINTSDVETGFGQGMTSSVSQSGFLTPQMTSSNSQAGFLSSVLPHHSFVTWNPISTIANNVIGLNDDITTDSQNVNCLKDKSCSDPPQIDLTDMDDSNSWLVDGGGSHPRSGGLHHCGGETITEGSWTTPAEPAWIPEEIASREDGDSRTSSVSMETSLNCEPPSRPSNWHSSVDSIIISSDSSVEKITKGSFTSQQVEGENVLGLEMETDRGENNDDIETSLTDILHPPPLHDSRPSECLNANVKKRKKPSPSSSSTTATTTANTSGGSKEKKKRDLEVRKDLTLPTAPTAGVDNVFQADDTRLADIDDNSVRSPSSSSHNLFSQNDEATMTSPGTEFQCRVCLMVLTTSGKLKWHLRNVHQITQTFSCVVCKESGFTEKESLKMHLYKTHGMGEFFRCEECNYETSIKVSYMRHISSHADTKMHCGKCNKAFKSKSGLKLHLKQHFDEKLHKCDFCPFKTPQRVNYLKHLATKHKKSEEGEELKMNVQCTLCSFKCVADYQLKAHLLRKHTSKEDMKYQCDSCDYASVERAALDKHVRFKHTNERPYLCQICGFSTHTISAMSRHKRGHSKTKPHVCETCGSAYADRKRLNDHILSHSGKLPFACDFCGFSSRRKDNLQAHIRRVHPELSHVNIIPTTKSSGFEEEEDLEGTSETPVRELEEVESKFFFVNPDPSEDEESNHQQTSSEDQGEKSQPLDRSHIVGHINRDGSIRPVVPVSTSVTANTSSPTFTSNLEHDYLPVSSSVSVAPTELIKK